MTEQIRTFSIRMAEAIDRRRFLRNMAGAAFAGATALSVGRLINPQAAYAYTSACLSPQGYGCPYGCGPSMCCSNGGRPSGCNCGTGTSCIDNGGHCLGYAGTWSGQNCWTCDYYDCDGGREEHYITTCCDCKTSGCNDSSGHCISYATQIYNVGTCSSATHYTITGKPQLIGVQTGDPRTSWGAGGSRSSGG